MTPLVYSVILQSMVGDESFSHDTAGIFVVVNYWQNKNVQNPNNFSAVFTEKLEDLIRRGVPGIACVLPWQAVESDISNSLVKFLVAASARKIKVRLVVTPELCIDYRDSGLPKDLVTKQENLARTTLGKPMVCAFAPRAFALPSMASQDFTKKFHNYLLRLDSLLGDAIKQSSGLSDFLEIWVGSGFWKYYTHPLDSTGDHSSAMATAFRLKLDEIFSSREFGGDIPTSAMRWRGRANELSNRAMFLDLSARSFRQRTLQLLSRKADGLAKREKELFTPEADPANRAQWTAALMSKTYSCFSGLLASLDRALLHTAPSIRWTDLGAFRWASDSERQFLLIRSIVGCVPKGGSVLVDEAQWFRFSDKFRTRAEKLCKTLQDGYRSLPKAVYWTPHELGPMDVMEYELKEKLPGEWARSSDPNWIERVSKALLVVVDPQVTIDVSKMDIMVNLAHAGSVVAIPRSSLFSDLARKTLESVLTDSGNPALDVRVGLSAKVKSIGNGKIVVYEPYDRDSGQVGAFLQSLISLAEVSPYFQVRNPKVELALIEGREQGALFIINRTPKQVEADVEFLGEVSISEFFGSKKRQDRFDEQESDSKKMSLSKKFKLEVPPFGILPVAVEGVGKDAVERRQASLLAKITEQGVEEAAFNELPGFGGLDRAMESDGIGSIWN